MIKILKEIISISIVIHFSMKNIRKNKFYIFYINYKKMKKINYFFIKKIKNTLMIPLTEIN